MSVKTALLHVSAVIFSIMQVTSYRYLELNAPSIMGRCFPPEITQHLRKGLKNYFKWAGCDHKELKKLEEGFEKLVPPEDKEIERLGIEAEAKNQAYSFIYRRVEELQELKLKNKGKLDDDVQEKLVKMESKLNAAYQEMSEAWKKHYDLPQPKDPLPKYEIEVNYAKEHKDTIINVLKNMIVHLHEQKTQQEAEQKIKQKAKQEIKQKNKYTEFSIFEVFIPVFPPGET